MIQIVWDIGSNDVILALSDLSDKPCSGHADQGDCKVGKHAHDGFDNDSIHSVLLPPFNARMAK